MTVSGLWQRQNSAMMMGIFAFRSDIAENMVIIIIIILKKRRGGAFHPLGLVHHAHDE